MAHEEAKQCPLCGGTNLLNLLRIEQVPVYCNVLWPDEQQALAAPRGELALHYCIACAHIFNAAFVPHLTDYTPDYDNSLHYSPRFNRYAEELAKNLVERHALHGKRIVEIGCGKGDFLRMLCMSGANRGFGFDRSFEPDRVVQSNQENVTFYQDFYNAEHARHCRPDFICCRHVLEHIQRPLDFLAALRETLRDGSPTTIHFEVPNALFTLKDMGIWDLIYEHCAYFTLNALISVFTRAGFEIVAADEAFGGQFIWVAGRPGSGASNVLLPADQHPAQIRKYANAFGDQYRANVQTWRQRLARMQRGGRRVVVWGGGSKGVTFLNVLKDHNDIRYVVDLNPHKQDRFIAGTGQRVVPPEFLHSYSTTDVIVMNPLYRDEINSNIIAMGLSSRLTVV